MDSFEKTKIAGAVLAALLLIFGGKTLIEMRAGHGGDKVGYTLPGGEPPGGEKKEMAAAPKDGAASAAAPAAKPDEVKTAVADAKPADTKPADAKQEAAPAAAAAAGGIGAEVAALLSKASADNGKSVFGKCKACHVNEKGKTPTVGPNLWGVVNRPKGSYPGFNYSEGMKAKGGNWTFEDLGNFIHNPKGYVAGTKMVFNGLESPADEADVIAYLATLADTPVPLPK